MDYRIIDENSVEITSPGTAGPFTWSPATEPVVTVFKKDFLESQIVAIQQSKDDFDAQRDIEILQCQNLLSLFPITTSDTTLSE